MTRDAGTMCTSRRHHVTYAPPLPPRSPPAPAFTRPIARPYLDLPQEKQAVLITNTTHGTRLRLTTISPCMGGSRKKIYSRAGYPLLGPLEISIMSGTSSRRVIQHPQRPTALFNYSTDIVLHCTRVYYIITLFFSLVSE